MNKLCTSSIGFKEACLENPFSLLTVSFISLSLMTYQYVISHTFHFCYNHAYTWSFHHEVSPVVGALHSHRERLGGSMTWFLFGVGCCRWMWKGSVSVLQDVEGWGERDWMLNFTLKVVKLKINLNKLLHKITFKMSLYEINFVSGVFNTADNVFVLQVKWN